MEAREGNSNPPRALKGTRTGWIVDVSGIGKPRLYRATLTCQSIEDRLRHVSRSRSARCHRSGDTGLLTRAGRRDPPGWKHDEHRSRVPVVAETAPARWSIPNLKARHRATPPCERPARRVRPPSESLPVWRCGSNGSLLNYRSRFIIPSPCENKYISFQYNRRLYR